MTDGTFVTVTTHYEPDGIAERGTSITIGDPKRGIFRLNEQARQLELISPLVDDRADDPVAALRDNPDYVREDTVQGYRTLVRRQPGSTDKDFIEQHHAPDLDGAIIKTVAVSPRGTTLIEPVEIKTGVPDLRLFPLLDLPVNTARFEAWIAKQEQKSGMELGTRLRQQVDRAKQGRGGN